MSNEKNSSCIHWADQMADRIMVIEDGKIKAIGTKDEIYPSLMGSSARHSSSNRPVSTCGV